jgi:hypothetical protein
MSSLYRKGVGFGLTFEPLEPLEPVTETLEVCGANGPRAPTLSCSFAGEVVTLVAGTSNALFYCARGQMRSEV